MIRIRFHGRGGHGVKTASRILGTAAFLAGYQCQDSPIYGAERRGAAVTAFTRIDDYPILERGMIEHPDLIVLADETLLNDSSAGVLAGQETASAIFVNTRLKSDMKNDVIVARMIEYDVTRLTMDLLGVAVALSAGLGAAAAKLTGLIDERFLVEALRQEYGELGLSDASVEKNIEIARTVFHALPVIEFQRQVVQLASDSVDERVVATEYDGAFHGAPSVVHPGNSELRKTGAWRVERPEIDLDTCTRCSLCYVMCPDAAVKLTREGFPVIDYDHCKGCMICRQLCPVKAIASVKETDAW